MVVLDVPVKRGLCAKGGANVEVLLALKHD